jgi:hypothetical protein
MREMSMGGVATVGLLCGEAALQYLRLKLNRCVTMSIGTQLRKVSLGTTCLIGAVALATAASAQTAGPKAPFTAFLDGDVNDNFGVISGQQNAGHARGVGMQADAWLRFTFEGHSDNGLTYGFYVRTLGTSSSISVDGYANDREATYLSSDYGYVEIGTGQSVGKESGAFTKAPYGPPGSSQKDLGPDEGLEKVFMVDPVAAAFNSNLGKFGGDVIGVTRATHIYYMSPEYHGFHISADYAPDGAGRTEEMYLTSTAGSAVTTTTQSTTNYQNLWEGLVGYKGTIGPVALTTNVAYSYGQSKNIFAAPSAGAPNGSSTAANTPISNVHTGFKANYNGIELGFDYTYAGDSVEPRNLSPSIKPVTSWGTAFAVNYYTGPWIIGALYWYARGPGIFSAVPVGGSYLGTTTTVPRTANGLWEQNLIDTGVGYQLAPGLRVYEVVSLYYDSDTHVQTQTGTAQRHPRGQIYITGITFDW